MPAVRLRFTVRGLMVAVAIAAVLLAGFIASRRFEAMRRAQVDLALRIAQPAPNGWSEADPPGTTYHNFNMGTGVHKMFAFSPRAEHELNRSYWYQFLAGVTIQTPITVLVTLLGNKFFADRRARKQARLPAADPGR